MIGRNGDSVAIQRVAAMRAHSRPRDAIVVSEGYGLARHTRAVCHVLACNHLTAQARR